jgi:hypothetical protein
VRRWLLLVAVMALAAGCGGGSKGPASTTATGPAGSTAQGVIPVIVYRTRGNLLEARRVLVPRTQAVARAALDALGVAGLRSVTIANGTATVDVSPAPTGLALAQIVFTLTEFPAVKQVAIGDRTLTRTDLDRYAPPIVVVEPQPGDTVTSPVRVHGNADAFEATFQIEVVDAHGKVLAQRTVTATAGSGERGSYDVTIPFEGAKPGPGKLVAYENSAENGQRIHVVEVPIVLS